MIFLHRTKLHVIEFGDTSVFDSAEWVIDVDLSAVIAWPKRYWVVTGDVVTLSSSADSDLQTAKIIDAKDTEAEKIEIASSFVGAFALLVLDEINLLRTEAGLIPRTLAQLKSALRSNMD